MPPPNDTEELRGQIWDWIYANGPKPVEEVSSHFEIAMPTAISILDHAWFSLADDVVTIAQSD